MRTLLLNLTHTLFVEKKLVLVLTLAFIRLQRNVGRTLTTIWGSMLWVNKKDKMLFSSTIMTKNSVLLNSIMSVGIMLLSGTNSKTKMTDAEAHFMKSLLHMTRKII